VHQVRSVVLGSTVDKVEKDRLRFCSYATQVSACGRPLFICSFAGACPFNGKSVRFKFHFSGFEVVWICPKLVGFPDMES